MKIIRIQIEDRVANDVDKQWLDDEILRKVEIRKKHNKKQMENIWLKRKKLMKKNAKKLTSHHNSQILWAEENTRKRAKMDTCAALTQNFH